MGINPMLVPVHQLCVTAAASQLLLSAGDVEQNPGPGENTPEYQTMVECSPTLKDILAPTAVDQIADYLFSKHVIEENTKNEVLQNITLTSWKKASLIVEEITGKVKVNEGHFHKFIDALSELDKWVREQCKPMLIKKFEELKAEASVTKPINKDHTQPSVQEPRSGRTTPEHRTMVKCTSLLVREFSKQIEEFGEAFYREEIIGPSTHRKTQWDRDEPENRARGLVSALTDKVQTSTENFGKIVQIIHDQGSYTNNTISGLRATFEQVNPSGFKFPVIIERIKSQKVSDEADDKPSKDFQCTFELPLDLTRRVEPNATPNDAQAAQVLTSKLWGHDVLLVYIYDHGKLRNFRLNEHNIIDWANIWNDKNGSIPRFKLTYDKESAHIRVRFGSRVECWSKVGTYAEGVTDKSKHTMILSLDSGNIDYSRHIVRHEFGHALGLLHEHQRSEFWKYASKFINLKKIENDCHVGKARMKDYICCPMDGEGTEYDPESIMHYWFKTSWLVQPYDTVHGIERDPNLKEVERTVLRGIHKRQTLAKDPSAKDIKFLASCYERKKKGEIVEVRPLGFAPSLFGSPEGDKPNTISGGQPKNLDAYQKANYITPSEIDRSVQGVQEQVFGQNIPAKHVAKYTADSERDGPPKPVFKVGFIGTTNSGKSTTLNALLGGEYLQATSGKTTACVVRIKPNPDPFSSEELVDEASSSMEKAVDQKEIFKMICERNKEKMENQSLPNKLVLSVYIKFLEGVTGNVELYDIPGVAEKEDTPVYQEMMEKAKEMDMLIVEVSQDSCHHYDLPIHLGKILHSGKNCKCLFLVNKYDLFFANREQLTEEKIGKICATFCVDVNQIVFTCATFALESRQRRRDDYHDLSNRAFYKLLDDLEKIPQAKDECAILEAGGPSLDNFKKLNSLMEKVSRIEDLEKYIRYCCDVFFKSRSNQGQQ